MSEASWTAIVLVAAIVYMTRAVGPIAMAGLAPSKRMVRFLDALALCIIVGLVASALAGSGTRELVASTVAAATMWLIHRSLWAMLAGILVAAAWTSLA